MSITEKPPSYDSFYGKIKHARDTSDGKVDFLKEAMKIAGASGKCILYSY